MKLNYTSQIKTVNVLLNAVVLAARILRVVSVFLFALCSSYLAFFKGDEEVYFGLLVGIFGFVLGWTGLWGLKKFRLCLEKEAAGVIG